MNLSNEKLAVITFNLVPDIGPVRLGLLKNYFGSAENALKAFRDGKASIPETANALNVSPKLIERVITALNKADVEKELNIARKENVGIFCAEDELYPRALLHIYDSPNVLYVKGELKPEDTLSVALVGSRRCSSYGLAAAAKFSGEFARMGVTTVSGLARGIDTQVHKETLKAGGRTLAVLGNGLTHHYPPENRQLEEKIMKSGALISEFPLEARPDKINFPRRNRLISGLSLATVVVEAELKSGALITASLSAEQGKDVFCVPGSIFSKCSEGCLELLKCGAAPATSARDVAEAILPLADWLRKKRIRARAKDEEVTLTDPREEEILNRIDQKPEGASIDYLTTHLKVSSGELAQSLLNLQIKGVVKGLPGNIFIRSKLL